MTESKKISETDQSDVIKKIAAAANYCYNCNRCVTSCPMAHVGVFNPRDLINDLTFLSVEEAIENNDIWKCLTCGQCTVYCPMTLNNEGVKIPELILELRKLAVELELDTEMEKLSQYQTHDGVFPIISELMAENPLPPNKLSFLEGSNAKITDKGEIAYFIGCLPLMEDIIYSNEIKYSDAAKVVINLLNEGNVIPVVLNEKCCGHDILWGQGDIETFKKLAEYNYKLYKDAGIKTVIVSCAEGYRTWKIDYPMVIKNFDLEVLHFSEFLVKNDIIENLRFPQEEPTTVTYHDACRIGRMGGKLYDAPREVISKLPGVKLIEMKNIKDDASCCGVSAFCGCNEYTKLIRKMRVQEAINTGANYLVVPCPKCLTHFNCYLSEPSLPEETKQKIQVIDLATFIGKRLFLV